MVEDTDAHMMAAQSLVEEGKLDFVRDMPRRSAKLKNLSLAAIVMRSSQAKGARRRSKTNRPRRRARRSARRSARPNPSRRWIGRLSFGSLKKSRKRGLSPGFESLGLRVNRATKRKATDDAMDD
jgi:hypothetical protein